MFHVSCYCGGAARDQALNDGDDSYKLDTEQRTPLHMAAINGHVEVIQLFGATSKRRPPRKYLGICNQPVSAQALHSALRSA